MTYSTFSVQQIFPRRKNKSIFTNLRVVLYILKIKCRIWKVSDKIFDFCVKSGDFSKWFPSACYTGSLRTSYWLAVLLSSFGVGASLLSLLSVSVYCAAPPANRYCQAQLRVPHSILILLGSSTPLLFVVTNTPSFSSVLPFCQNTLQLCLPWEKMFTTFTSKKAGRTFSMF